MNLILDSNIYLQDITMNGTQFQELFAYLRRTDSNLVIPTIVFLEVIERYKERLTQKVDAARKAWNTMQKTALSNVGAFRGAYINFEVRTLRRKLREPAPGVHSIIHGDLSGVDLQEVLRRGIKRIRPASEQGEELRDVVLWMVVLQYAAKRRNEVVFLSNDSGFKDADNKGLHPHLVSDLTSSKTAIRFYSKIDEFLAGESLETEEISAEWIFSVIAEAEFEKEVKKQIAIHTRPEEIILNIELEDLEFLVGKKFKITEDTSYVESSFSGKARITVRYTPPAGLTANIWSMKPVTLSALGSLTPAPPFNFESKSLLGFTKAAVKSKLQSQTHAVQSSYGIEFNFRVSARVANGKLLAFQTDNFSRTILPDEDQSNIFAKLT